MSKNKFKITKKILAKEENQVDSRLYEIISKNAQINMLKSEVNNLLRGVLQYKTQLDQKKAMWNELKEWIDNNINSMSDSANYRQKEQLKFVKQKMQQLEKGEKDVED